MKIDLTLLIIMSIAIVGCSSSNEDDSKVSGQINEVIPTLGEKELKVKKIANNYNAIFVNPYSKDWSRKYSYELQDAFGNKKIIFEAKLVDIAKLNNGYELQFGDYIISNTTFLLTSTYDVVNKISKSESKRFIVIATIKSIDPILSNKADSVPLEEAADSASSSGQSYLIKGTLDDYLIKQDSILE